MFEKDIKETKPPVTTVTRKVVGEEDDHPMTFASIAITALIACVSVPMMLVIGHALPLLDAFFQGMKPLVGLLGYVFCLALFVLIALGLWYVHDRFRVDIKKRVIEARKFAVDPQNGNYDAYFIDKKETFIAPQPGQIAPPVPSHYAPSVSYINKVATKKDEDLTGMTVDANTAKPSVEELASKVERNSLQVCLGRSLTTPGQYLIAKIIKAHIKIIGTSQMGKSCLVGSILEQIQQTHDPECIQVAFLDFEDRTGRLFEKSAHLARLDIGRGNTAIMHARHFEEIPVYLHYIIEELERRDRLDVEELEKLPHILVYMEEFLDLKNRLKLQGGKVYDQFLTDFSTLATRGLKQKLHALCCAQVDYADEDLRDAMAQFAVGAAFSVKPTAAQAAGFIRSDLLKQNFAMKTPGYFVIEMPGTSDLGIAPEYDVEAKLLALDSPKKTVVLDPKKTAVLSPESSLQPDRNQFGNQSAPPLEAMVAELEGEEWMIENFNWKLHQMKSLLHTVQEEQYLKIWKVSPGPGRAYKKARAEREVLVKCIQDSL